MFPTHVGMNRNGDMEAWNQLYVPHTRGDEPQHLRQRSSLRHVPHTRGDEPKDGVLMMTYEECSPHTWG